MEGVTEEQARRAGLDPSDPRLSQTLTLAVQLTAFPAICPSTSAASSSSRNALDEIVPIENAAMDKRKVIEWDKDDLDVLGMLKVDVLALGMLSCLRARLRSAVASTTVIDHDACEHPGRRKSGLRHAVTRRHHRRVPGREPRADVDAAAPAAEGILRSRHRSRDRAARSDPGRHGASLSAPAEGIEKVDYPSPVRVRHKDELEKVLEEPWACRCSRSRRCRSPSSRRILAG